MNKRMGGRPVEFWHMGAFPKSVARGRKYRVPVSGIPMFIFADQEVSHFSEEMIIAILKEVDARVNAAERNSRFHWQGSRK